MDYKIIFNYAAAVAEFPQNSVIFTSSLPITFNDFKESVAHEAHHFTPIEIKVIVYNVDSIGMNE